MVQLVERCSSVIGDTFEPEEKEYSLLPEMLKLHLTYRASKGRWVATIWNGDVVIASQEDYEKIDAARAAVQEANRRT